MKHPVPYKRFCTRKDKIFTTTIGIYRYCRIYWSVKTDIILSPGNGWIGQNTARIHMLNRYTLEITSLPIREPAVIHDAGKPGGIRYRDRAASRKPQKITLQLFCVGSKSSCVWWLGTYHGGRIRIQRGVEGVVWWPWLRCRRCVHLACNGK